MKKLSILPAILILALCFGAAQVFAQQTEKPTRVILKLFVQDTFSETYTIPVDVNKKGSKDRSGGGVAKDYGPNYDPKTDPPFGPGYEYDWKAVVISKTQTRITLSVKIDDGEDVGRKVKKTFVVTNGQETKIQLKRNVAVVAYYGLEEDRPEETEESEN
jgi:hypothetical protein